MFSYWILQNFQDIFCITWPGECLCEYLFVRVNKFSHGSHFAYKFSKFCVDYISQIKTIKRDRKSFIINLSLIKKNLYMLYWIVLLFRGQNIKMKITNIIVYFTIHFHFSNIFPDFSQVLNLWMSVLEIFRTDQFSQMGKFCDISHGFYFTEKAIICEIREI